MRVCNNDVGNMTASGSAQDMELLYCRCPYEASRWVLDIMTPYVDRGSGTIFRNGYLAITMFQLLAGVVIT